MALRQSRSFDSQLAGARGQMGYIARKGKAVGDREASVCTSFVGSLSPAPLEAGQGKGQGLHSKEGAVLASHSDLSYNFAVVLRLYSFYLFNV